MISTDSTEVALFLSAFIASTIAPGGSEALLGWLVVNDQHDALRLLFIASVGNTLGALTTWGLGYWFSHFRSLEQLQSRLSPHTLQLLQRWGIPLLLFSWLPVVGDGFCLAAGWLRLPLLLSAAAILAGKVMRYWLVIQAAQGLA
jgi:membrane protein YqaA with SNARE-associated domain